MHEDFKVYVKGANIKRETQDMEDLKVHNKTANIALGKYWKDLVWENFKIYAE